MTPPEIDKRHEVGLKFADDDTLGHGRLAAHVVRDVINMRPGSVISVQASWGRGKTDVVARAFESMRANGEHPTPIWINPWQYGTPDLIKPVVLEILRRLVPGGRSLSTRARRAARTLLRAGNAMLFKAISVVAPFGEIIAAGEKQVDELLSDLFKDGAKAATDADPVYAMAERFRELVDEYLQHSGRPDGRLLICVDDLDRCLPDHQIAMLEAIYFLTSAEANCSFLIALDPVLVQQAAQAHYKTSGFDSEQYLNKLFDFRVNLPPLAADAVAALVLSKLAEIRVRDSRGAPIEQAFRAEPDDLATAFGDVLFWPELTNPRLIRRILERVAMLSQRLVAAEDRRLAGKEKLRSVVACCALAERWPQAREVFQVGNLPWGGNAELICFSYGIYTPVYFRDRAELETALVEHANVIARLPEKSKAPDLGGFLLETLFHAGDQALDTMQDTDRILVNYGL